MQFQNYFTALRKSLVAESHKSDGHQLGGDPALQVQGILAESTSSENDNKYSWQENELQECIEAAQKFDQKAMDKLCACFEPLIMRQVYMARQNTKMDPEELRNHAWVIFIDLLMNFRDKDYAGFPGYATLRIHSQLQRLVITNGIQCNTESLNIEYENNQEPEGFDNISNFITQHSLAEAMKKITPRQRDILNDSYLNDKSTAQIAKEIALSPDRVRHIKKDALNALNSILS